jgi:nitroreductase
MKHRGSARPTTGTLVDGVVRNVVDLARWAPSIHNTQPWTWRRHGDVLELWADHARALPAIDPSGRHLVISCGSALHHAVVAAGALGVNTRVTERPDPAQDDLLARVELSPGTPDPEGERTVEAIHHRLTDRRRFTSWPVPDERVVALAKAAHPWHAEAIPVVDVSFRFRVEVLLERARLSLAHDPAYVAETDRWLDHSSTDGIPRDTIPDLTGRPGERAHRFTPDLRLPRSSKVVESTDGLLVIATPTDDPRAWLHAGAALSALWLHATAEGLSLVPLSQVVEDPTTRRSLGAELPTDLPHPQVLARIGWQEISRSTLPRTPRRPLDDVLVDE